MQDLIIDARCAGKSGSSTVKDLSSRPPLVWCVLNGLDHVYNLQTGVYSLVWPDPFSAREKGLVAQSISSCAVCQQNLGGLIGTD